MVILLCSIVFNVFIATVTNQYGKVLDSVETEKKKKIEAGQKNKGQEIIITSQPIKEESPLKEGSNNQAIGILLSTVDNLVNSINDMISKEPNESKANLLKSNAESINKIISNMQKLGKNPS